MHIYAHLYTCGQINFAHTKTGNKQKTGVPKSGNLEDLMWHQVYELQAPDASCLLRWATQFKTRPIRGGTACSGSDVVTKAFGHMLRAINKRFGLQLEIVWEFAVELDSEKRTWIQNNCPDTRCIFSDITKENDC